MKAQLVYSMLIILSLLFLPLSAQVVVEEEIQTDTVDIFASVDQEVERSRSRKIAIWANLLVPGLGHHYIKEYNRAMIYLATEATLILGMVFCEKYSRNLYEESRSYAWNYAKTRCAKDRDDVYWQIIGNESFINYKQYNDAVVHNRDFSLKYISPDERWEWQNEVYQNRYREFRKNAMQFHVVSSFFLGSLFLNRIVSFIDVRVTAKYSNKRKAVKDIEVYPNYSFAKQKIGFSLSGKF